jgi:DNA-binding NarL/FixJ family response regulator
LTIRVLIADDQELVRAGFRMIVDARDDLEVVGEAANGEQAVSLAEALRPDVILMDVRMPVMDGLDATRRLLNRTSGEHEEWNPRVIILTTFDLDQYVYDGLRAGASGFLLKDTPPEDLAAAIRVVASGEAMLSPSVTRRLIERFTGLPGRTAGDPTVLRELTPREAEVLRLLARGLSNAVIAATLHVSETTVKSHVARILMKLDLHDRVQAVVLAYETGFVAPGSGAAD